MSLAAPDAARRVSPASCCHMPRDDAMRDEDVSKPMLRGCYSAVRVSR